MDKKELLDLAQKDKRGKEYENKAFTRSGELASTVTIILGITLFLIELFTRKTVNVELLALAFSTISFQALIEGIKVKRIFEIVLGSIGVVVTLVLTIVAITIMAG